MSRTYRAGLAEVSVIAVAWLAAPSAASRADPLPAGAARVVELFTSQGCPKCPPADRLVGDLAREPGTIALSYAVNYWDYAGWHDTLAAPEFAERQHAYAAARGDRLIFTPQAIVDGRAVEPGADREAILRDMSAPREPAAALEVPLGLTETGGTLHIAIGAVVGPGAPVTTAQVLVARVVREMTVRIDRGANSGRSITYTNAVRAMRNLGTWAGKPETFDLLELAGDGEGYVVLLQAGTPDKPGVILAAAQTSPR